LKKKSEWQTAAEIMAELEADPVWVADRDRRAREHQARLDARDATLVPLEDELRALGLPSLTALCSSSKPPRFLSAVPILLAHLQKIDAYPKDARELIASALFVREMKIHWHVLVQLFRDEREESVKDILANAIIRAVDADVLADVIALVRDPQQGPSRILLLRTLDKSKDPRAHATIDDLADDPDLREEIKDIFKRREQRKARRLKRMH
jgi:hypothetical protein